MKKWWIRKAKSWEEAQEQDDEYYRLSSPEQRLSDIQFCREMYFKLKGININEVRKGLRRFFKVTEQK
jgi:hypothetical protein